MGRPDGECRCLDNASTAYFSRPVPADTNETFEKIGNRPGCAVVRIRIGNTLVLGQLLIAAHEEQSIRLCLYNKAFYRDLCRIDAGFPGIGAIADHNYRFVRWRHLINGLQLGSRCEKDNLYQFLYLDFQIVTRVVVSHINFRCRFSISNDIERFVLRGCVDCYWCQVFDSREFGILSLQSWQKGYKDETNINKESLRQFIR